MVARVDAQSNVADVLEMLPTTFVIGDFQDEYEYLTNEFPEILIKACDNDLPAAQSVWFDYMKAMEDYSHEIEFDLGGVVFWIHFFWDTNGEVDYIAYHLQPHSRLVKDDLMLAFLQSFAASNKIKTQAAQPFAHYGSASFPLYFQRPATKSKQ